jgi:hypothetical protein
VDAGGIIDADKNQQCSKFASYAAVLFGLCLSSQPKSPKTPKFKSFNFIYMLHLLYEIRKMVKMSLLGFWAVA